MARANAAPTVFPSSLARVALLPLLLLLGLICVHVASGQTLRGAPLLEPERASATSSAAGPYRSIGSAVSARRGLASASATDGKSLGTAVRAHRQLQSCSDTQTWCSSWTQYCGGGYFYEGKAIEDICPATCDACVSPATNPQPTKDGTSFNADLLELVNELRTANKKAPLCLNAKLTAAAKIHAEDMELVLKDLTHVGSDMSSVGMRLDRVAFDWTAVGENIAWNQVTAQEVFTAWANSPGHKANMLGEFKFMGVFKSGVYWAQVFADSETETCDASAV